MTVYVLTMGKDLYYASEIYEDACYEKEYTEEETWQGRHQGVKLTQVVIDKDTPDKMLIMSNGVAYSTESIINLL